MSHTAINRPLISLSGRIVNGHRIIRRYNKVDIGPAGIFVVSAAAPWILLQQGMNVPLSLALAGPVFLVCPFWSIQFLSRWVLSDAHRIAAPTEINLQLAKQHEQKEAVHDDLRRKFRSLTRANSCREASNLPLH